MKRSLILGASALFALASMAQNAITAIGQPVASVEAIDGTYILHNTGRDSYFCENAYGKLVMGQRPVTGNDAGLDYVVTVKPDGNGKFTFMTRRGRYVPEVGDGAVSSVGKEANAGHFTVSRAANGHFTIVNSVNTAYGFDANPSQFVGWNAADGSNCYYELIPVETGMGNYPLGVYEEPAGGEVSGADEWASLDPNQVYVSWASKDVNYERRAVPQLKMRADTTVYAWRGERLSVKALVFSSTSTPELNVKLSGDMADESSARWMRYVITDEHNHCGNHSFDLPTWTTADVIDVDGSASVGERSVRPVWCTIEVPADIAAGEHLLKLNVSESGSSKSVGELTLKVNVAERTLPAASQWKFHLDLWQQPYSVSRYHGVERWSRAHLDALRPYMELLARGGQKVVTAILFHEPWGDQSHDKFDPMVETMLGTDGKWHFDYTVFDRWVQFMESCGISSRINCFSMIPWDMSFRYIDEATDTYRFLSAQTSSDEYSELWKAFLTDFAAHLRAKGWFDKTCISMDERGLSAMLDAARILNETVPDMKMALAGNYHKELVDVLDDYCLAYEQRFTNEELARRKAAGMISTVYTCCTEARPNLFTNSLPAEGAYLPIQAFASGYDGYLRWAVINWHETPLTDSRFRLFGSGDTFMLYPGARSSVRYERLVEGIQQTEKARILRAAWAEEGHNDSIAMLNAALQPFVERKFTSVQTAASMVNTLEALLNGSPEFAIEVPTAYCTVSLADAKKDVALANRYLTSVYTTGCVTNLNYSGTSAGKDGVIVAEPIAVKPGSQFKLVLKAVTNSDDLRYCRVAVGADWNRDFMFNALHGEEVLRAGDAKAANEGLLDLEVTVNVPADALKGSSLLRVVYADAWSPEPDFCGELSKGFAFDIPMEILDSEDALTAIGFDNRTRWNGNTLTAPEKVNIDVYGLSGLLLDSARGVRTHTFGGYAPTVYTVVVSFDDGHREIYKRKFD
ncbi:MAG: DUF4091 domain-containing protein [Muribaculaceae bacterium]|nr:DUF4091 domain-containing protein [Muribaculaceae bacterium]